MPSSVALRENALVSYDGENWRIVHIPDCQRVLAIRIRDERLEFLPLEGLRQPIETVKKEELDSAEMATGGSDTNTDGEQQPDTNKRRIRQLPAQRNLSDKQLEARNRAVLQFEMGQAILKAPRHKRRQLISELCKEFSFNQATAYRRLKILKKYNTADALMHAVRSDMGKSRIPDDVCNTIREHLKIHRFISEPKTIPAILNMINGKYQSEPDKQISKTTLRKFEQETTLKQKLEAQGQKKKAKDAFRAKAGHLPNKDYPLAIVQVDHTPIQVCLVDEVDRLPINDAWLTLVIDAYCRMVLGFYLTFEAPSTLSTGLALAHAFLPKEEYLHMLGIKGEWPCWGFPDVVLVDNAAELNGHMMHAARRRYRFTLRDRPVDAPNFGGHVESAFRTFMNEFKSLPGTKFSNPVERGEYDSEGRAIFTIAEFEALFTEFLVNDYHLREHRGDGMDGSVPLLKWKQGIFEGDRMPPTGLPDRPGDPMALRISLMPFKRRTVRNGRIEMLDEEYHSGALTLIGDTVDLTKPLEDRKFEIRYDPRNISKVWFYFEPNDSYIEVPFADLRKTPISLWERDARKRRQGKPSEQFLGQRYQSQLLREDMKMSAAKKTKRQRLEAEKARRRALGALVQPTPAVPTPSKSAPQKPRLDPERLKALREKVRPADPVASVAKDSNDET